MSDAPTPNPQQPGTPEGPAAPTTSAGEYESAGRAGRVDPGRGDGTPAPNERLASRKRTAWTLIVLGVAAIGLSAITLASAGYGGAPAQGFAQRRSYDMVKRDVHRAFPIAVLQGLAGLGLTIAGRRRLARLQESE